MERAHEHQHQPAQQPKQKRGGSRNGREKKRSPSVVQLKTVERVFKWPLVETTWKQGTEVYGRIKGANFLITWTFDLAENTCIKIITLSRPVVNSLKKPIDFVDATVDKGLCKLEERAPIIKEEPAAILEQTKECVMGVVQPTITRATNIVIYSKDKANNVLSTTYGSKVVNEVDKLILGADQLIDRFLPKRSDEGQKKSAVPITDDPLLHVIEQFGLVVCKFTRRALFTFHA